VHSDDQRPPPASRGRRLALATALSLGMAAPSFISFSIGALGPVLRADLSIESAQIGLIVTLCLGSGALFSPILGPRAGMFGSRRGLIVLFSYVAVGYLAMALSTTFQVLAAVVVLAGISTSLSNPLTNYVITDVTQPGQRGVILGIKQSGVQLSLFLAGAILPSVALLTSWRVAIAVATCIPLVGIATTMYSVPGTGRGVRGSRPRPVSVRTVVGQHPFVVWFGLYALFMGTSISAAGAYLPLYAYDELGFGVRLAGFAGSVVGLAGVPARLVWGRAVEHRREFLVKDMLVVSTGSVLSAAAVFLAAALGPVLLWVGAVGLGALASGWQVIAMMAAIRDLPEDHTSAGTGVIQTGFLLGLLAGPLIFGAAHSRFGDYRSGWLAVGAGFACAGVVVSLWRPRRRAAREPVVR